MNILKIFQPPAWKHFTLETPGHSVIVGTFSKPVPALRTMFGRATGKAAVASDFLSRHLLRLRQPVNGARVLIAKCKIMGTGTAIQAADAHQMSFVFSHNASPRDRRSGVIFILFPQGCDMNNPLPRLWIRWHCNILLQTTQRPAPHQKA